MKLTVENVRYHVEICGSGFPLLLLHGFTGDSSTWTSFCGQWGGTSKLIIPDIIGHGQTESPLDVERYSMEAAVHDLKGILEQLNVERVDLLGYSMGGRLALSFAMHFPDKVRKLVLESASPGLATKEERANRRLKDAELANFIKEKGIKMFVDYWEGLPLFSTLKRLPSAIWEGIRSQRLRNSPDGLANCLLGMGTGSQPSWWDKLDQLPYEVLLLTGEEDAKFCSIAERMLQKLKKGTWITFENSSHLIHVEEREKFGTIVSDFLS